MTKPQIGRMLVVGLGLIGGSLAMAARRWDLVGEVWAVNRSRPSLDFALQQGIVDRVAQDAETLLPELGPGDVVVIGVPVLAVGPLLEQLARSLSPEVTVTDVGSTKGWLVQEAQRVWGKLPEALVPSHPIAGSEKSGVQAAHSDLFVDHRVIITPTGYESRRHRECVEELWKGVGARIDLMSPEHHDEILGATSHLPHVLAFVLVDLLASMDEKREVLKYAAGGFRDFTRIASSDPLMWRDIMIANRAAISESIDRFEQHLDELKDALASESEVRLMKMFQRAQATRNAFVRQSEKNRAGE
jgi:cyclohexadieny/prephenate dehydrogenase / 3-phosphoshikimate 1-carboxyvinyltransferase